MHVDCLPHVYTSSQRELGLTQGQGMGMTSWSPFLQNAWVAALHREWEDSGLGRNIEGSVEGSALVGRSSDSAHTLLEVRTMDYKWGPCVQDVHVCVSGAFTCVHAHAYLYTHMCVCEKEAF